jgi:WD40 repeat protein
MNDVFISYSRRDKVFTQKLYEAFTSVERKVWADWDSIPASSDWFAEIKQGIQETDSVVFVLSPEWIKSNECRKELNYALEMGKRLFPILYLPVDPKDVPPELAKINWVYMREDDDFDKGFQTLCSAMDTDLDWIKAHTRIQIRALEWEKKNRDNSLTLRGNDLTEGEQFIASAANKNPVPTQLQSEFILASRKDATRRQRQTLAGVTVALVISIALGVLAFFQRQEAVRQAKVALARQLASQAQLLNNVDNSKQMVASLLSIQSMKLYANGDAASFLLNNNLAAQPVIQMNPGGEVWSVTFSPDGNYTASLGYDENNNRNIYVWQTESGIKINRFTDKLVGYPDIAFSSDSKHVVYYLCDQFDETSNCVDFSIQITDIRTGKKVANIPYDGYPTSSFTFSPDGKYIASHGCEQVNPQGWCDKSYILISDVLTGTDILRIHGNTYPFPYKFSPNGEFIASVDCDQLDKATGNCHQQSKSLLRVQEVTTGKEVANLTFDGVLQNRLVLSPDIQYLALERSDQSVALWDIANAKELAQKTFDDRVDNMTFSPDGKYVAVNSHLWETTTGNITGTDLSGLPIFSPDGKYFLLQPPTTSGLVLWDVAADKALLNIPNQEGINAFSFSPDGRYMVATGVNGTARVWESATGLEVARMTHDKQVNSVAFSPDGKFVVSGGYDGTVRVWKVATNKDVLQVPDSNEFIGVIKNKYLVSARCDEYFTYGSCKKITTISVVEIPGGNEVHTTFEKAIREWKEGGDFQVSRIEALSPDGSYLASIECLPIKEDSSSCFQEIVHIWDTTTGKETSQRSFANIKSNMAFSPNSQSIVLASCEDKSDAGCAKSSVLLWEAETGREIAQATVGADLGDFTFSTDGRYITLEAYEPNASEAAILVWDALTLQNISRINSSGMSFIFSPDGKSLVVGHPVTADVWNVVTGEYVSQVNHDKITNLNAFSFFGGVSVAFSQDGKYIVTGSADQTARVWDVSSGREVARVTHENAVALVAMSPDGKIAVSASIDGVIRVWNAFTGQEYARKKIIVCDNCDLTNKMYFLSFSSEGRYVISNDYVWMWRPDDIIANACAYLSRNLTRAEWARFIGDAMPYEAVCENLPIEPEITETPTVTP